MSHSSSSSNGGSFGDTAVGEIGLPNYGSSTPALAAAAEAYRPRIDGYLIEERIGEGGMGTVWKAMQASTRRRVALKLMSRGAFSEAARLRFDREVALAARLAHPHVARVYDSGACGALSYYAMELIEGAHLDRHVEEQKLDTRQVLRLMRDVAAAVHFAHQRGVIHRDLKPSNILVTPDGQPHVVDFGLAKATEPDEGDLALTQEAQSTGTPGFMAPEQAAGRLDEIDTRTDVYGLGATLYMLLTGHLPHDLSGPRYEAIRRVADGEVRPPRRATPDLPKELEWLLLKALAKEPRHRYGSAEALARDVDRYLSSEPLEACPPSRGYRLRKFARRNKALLATTCFIAAVLVAATVLSTWQAVRATRAEHLVTRERDQALTEKRRADEQAEIARAINAFLNEDVLGQADPHNQAAGAAPPDRDLRVREALDRAATRIEGRFAAQPLLEASIRYAVGTAYRGVGEFDKAEKHLGTALDLRRTSGGNLHPDTLTSLSALAAVYVEQGRYGDAEPLINEALRGAREALGPKHPRAIELVRELGELYIWQLKFAEAEPLLLEALRGSREVLGGAHEKTLRAAAELAWVYRQQRRFEEAERLMLQATEGLRSILGPRHPARLMLLQNFAVVYIAQRKFDRAIPLLREALDGLSQSLGEQHPETLYVVYNLGDAYLGTGRLDDAEEMLRRALDGRRNVLGKQHRVTLGALDKLAQIHVAQERYADAERLYREGIAIRRQWPLPHSPDRLPLALIRLASVLRLQGRDADAEPLLRETLQIREQAFPADDYRVAQAKSMLGATLSAVGRPEDAEPLLRAAYEGLTAHPPPPSDPEQPKVTVERIIELYDKWGRPEHAAAWRSKLTATQPATQHSAVIGPADQR